MKYLGIIPARANSKGLPNKNIKYWNGAPLINKTLISAKQSELLTDFVVSTDSKLIVQLSKDYTDQILIRPRHLASDTASMVDVVVDILNKYKKDTYDYFCLLQPTSPTRNANDIDNAIKIVEKSKCQSLVGVTEPIQYPYDMCYFQQNKLKFVIDRNTKQRQQLAKYYFINGALYIVNIKRFLTNKKFVDKNSEIYLMSDIDGIDIDNEFQFNLSEIYWNKYGK